MARSLLLLLFLTWALCPSLHGQSLIADPGFEVWDGAVGTSPNTLQPLTHWYNANGTPDHHHQLNPPGSNLTSLEPCPTGQGQTQCGTPFAGQGVLGCWKGNGVDGTREWAGTKLLQPMVAGGCYRIAYEVQNKEDHPNFYMATNQWGLFFSQSALPSFNPDVSSYANKTKQFVTCSEVIDSSVWSHQEFLYVADKPYTHAFLGYVGDVSKSTFTAWSNDWLIGFYVWFDEVQIERIEPQLTVSPDITICLGDSVLLAAVSNFPMEWTIGTVADTTGQIWVRPQITTTCVARTLDGTACSVSREITITVLGTEEREFKDRVCISTAPFQLEQASGSGKWSGPGIIDAQKGLFDPAVSGTGEFLLRYEDATDCGKSYTLRLLVEAEPDLSFSADPQEGCVPLTVRFMETSPVPGNSPRWDFGDGNTAIQSGMVEHAFLKSGSFPVKLQAEFSPFCPMTFTLPITVHPAVTADFVTDPTDPTILEPLVRFTDKSSGPVQDWNWDFGDGQGDTQRNPLHPYTNPGIYAVSLVVTGTGGCRDTLVKELRIADDVTFFIPTSFSPNGDGINDVFRAFPKGKAYGFLMEVYDRWGGLVYRGTDAASGWDGRSPDGSRAETGLYVYRIVARGADPDFEVQAPQRTFSGEVLLVR